MTIEAPHTTGLFAELLEGAKALAERPTLIADAERAKAEAAHHASMVDDYRKAFDDMKAQIDSLTAQLASKEADLAQATKSKEDVDSKLSVLLDAVRGVVGEVNAAVSLVEPPSAAKPAEVDATPSDAQGSSNESANGDSATTAGQSQGQSASSPTNGGQGATSQSGQGDNGGGSAATATYREGEASPSPLPPSNGAGDASGDASPGASGRGESDTPLAPGSSASSTGEASNAAPAMNNTQREPGSTADPSATASQPKDYWNKPDGMSWADWAASGGHLPAWERPAAQ